MSDKFLILCINDFPCVGTITVTLKVRSLYLVTAITDVRNGDPIREFSAESCDTESDSAFPSVFGTEHDVILLSQSFDDAAWMSDFSAPSGTSTLGYVRVTEDVSFDVTHFNYVLPRLCSTELTTIFFTLPKAGFLYGEELDQTEPTGIIRTGGRGGPSCKDALLSVVVNRGDWV